jgi:molybdenum cofactor cytidylyltransferase
MRIDAAILAAGRSRRMGRDKLGIRTAGRSVLEIVISNHVAGGLDRICVVVPSGESPSARIARAFGDRVEPVEVERSLPMSESLRAGWTELLRIPPPGGIMISLGDMPLVTPEVIDVLIGSYREWPGGICVPVKSGRRGHPVILSPDFGPEVMDIRGDRGARSVLERHPGAVLEVEVDSDGVLMDVDRPGDLGAVEEGLAGNG